MRAVCRRRGNRLSPGMLVGGPIVYSCCRRIRAALGLPDNSYAAVQACAAAEAIGEASPPAPRPIRVNVMPPAPRPSEQHCVMALAGA